jgi:ribonucleoside-triphosphate reductase
MESHSEFVFYRTYARWDDNLKRRETFEEAVDRYINFLKEISEEKVPPKVFRKIKQYMLSLDVFGSMRLFWTAGKASRDNNIAAYNCSFITVDEIKAFSEMTYVLMCGTGVGFSCESKYVSQLPEINCKKFPEIMNRSSIEDSKEGWADSIKLLLESLYKGEDIDFDYSLIRKKGERLKTIGGRASGPAPLINTHAFIREVFNNAQGRKLLDIEVHDICCQIAEMVVVGGVRRSALISLSDLDSDNLRNAKTGRFPLKRYLANNSWVANEKPDAITFMREWAALASSGSGERGISNLGAMKKKTNRKILGFNPCHEIGLDNREFCNLSEIVVKETDDIDTLLHKVETATWIGLIQSTLTDFPYLSEEWKINCEKNRLLGVSLTGQLDNPDLLSEENLKALRNKAYKIAKIGSKKLGINMPAAITCGKPSGTLSQLVNCASGCHPWWSEYMIRRYRISSNDPIIKLLQHHNISLLPEVGEENLARPNTYIVEFPIKAHGTSVTKKDMGAMDQLEWYKKIQKYWCDHNQSCTIYVKPDEWVKVGNWVYENWDDIVGVSFLPDDGGIYKLAPFESITEEEYNKKKSNFPEIDYSLLSRFELEDNTEGAKTFACTGDKCELA